MFNRLIIHKQHIESIKRINGYLLFNHQITKWGSLTSQRGIHTMRNFTDLYNTDGEDHSDRDGKMPSQTPLYLLQEKLIQSTLKMPYTGTRKPMQDPTQLKPLGPLGDDEVYEYDPQDEFDDNNPEVLDSGVDRPDYWGENAEGRGGMTPWEYIQKNHDMKEDNKQYDTNLPKLEAGLWEKLHDKPLEKYRTKKNRNASVVIRKLKDLIEILSKRREKDWGVRAKYTLANVYKEERRFEDARIVFKEIEELMKDYEIRRLIGHQPKYRMDFLKEFYISYAEVLFTLFINSIVPGNNTTNQKKKRKNNIQYSQEEKENLYKESETNTQNYLDWDCKESFPLELMAFIKSNYNVFGVEIAGCINALGDSHDTQIKFYKDIIYKIFIKETETNQKIYEITKSPLDMHHPLYTILIRLATDSIEKEEFDNAKIYTTIAEKYHYTPELVNCKSLILKGNGKINEALEECNKGLKMDKDDLDLYFTKIHLLITLKDIKGCIEFIRQFDSNVDVIKDGFKLKRLVPRVIKSNANVQHHYKMIYYGYYLTKLLVSELPQQYNLSYNDLEIAQYKENFRTSSLGIHEMDDTSEIMVEALTRLYGVENFTSHIPLVSNIFYMYLYTFKSIVNYANSPSSDVINIYVPFQGKTELAHTAIQTIYDTTMDDFKKFMEGL